MIAVSPPRCAAVGASAGCDASTVLQHVSIEVLPADVADAIGFWRLLRFEHVDAPEPLADHVTWLERGGTQIHMIHTDAATVPVLGHAAVVVDDFEAALAGLSDAGHRVEETRELWGARRAFAIAPGGHRVELMAAPPPAKR
jgi:hypothetical protein